MEHHDHDHHAHHMPEVTTTGISGSPLNTQHHHGGDEDMECPMQMIFHLGHCEAILFKSWTVSEVGGFVGAAILIFVVAVLYEGLKYLREKLYYDAHQMEFSQQDKEGSTQNLRNTSKPIRQQIFNKAHIIQTFLHLIQVSVSYALMLIVMTYNVWLFLAVVLGACAGYLFFGWIRNRSVDITEHCH
ncbi:high affinity copper uptake protein 1 [Lutzomyia longipalpis]|uniref:high affinity copper uptake protein 1 n=1 Tax=Lutzomyia longipalpis TaxID=7200 RepID=UPI0024844672|nr:high affinity copper uptake protein 1 [Lutzomyia longipalpis]XP_055695630.1 high affinity copper uptake protein 1 [Lutzomyia longipalpis]XP_055695631.1 high affinity copper uptake protein 1 [Lutzomyia longipalpis]XP_055695632.1 high affinity copper uptake protein 1 [Lutzomyia longipalpis]XP_055695633.1 high affinity copper uptake protein 1 [Lutzomyia longipalpis]